MKRRLATLLALVLAFTTCCIFPSNAEVRKYSIRWYQTADDVWHITKDGSLIRNTWLLDDECDVEGGLWYLIDENGDMISDPLIMDGNGRYYSIQQIHDGHFGMATEISAADAAKAETDIRELKPVTAPQILRLSEARSNVIIDDSSSDCGYEQVTETEKKSEEEPVTILRITANSCSKKYDGLALADDGYTYTQGILKDGDVLSATVEGTITDAGSVSNEVTSYIVMRDTQDVTDEYDIEIINGTLTVNKRSVTLISATDEKKEDGNPLTNDTVTESGDGFADGEGATYEVTGSQTEIGTSANTFEYELNDGTSESNYTITKEEGTLTVMSDDCVLEGTLITLADGSQKKVEDLAADDVLLSYDFFEGKMLPRKLLGCVRSEAEEDDIIRLKTKKGNELTIVGAEAVFDMDAKTYVDIDASSYADAIGMHVMINENGHYGIDEIIDARYTREGAVFYEVYTETSTNYVANNILVNYPHYFAFEFLALDENYKIDTAAFAQDVKDYGLYTYEEFADVMSEDFFEKFGVAIHKIIVEKTGLSFEEVLEAYVGFEEELKESISELKRK